MEFSSTFSTTMEAMAGAPPSYRGLETNGSVQSALAYTTMLQFNLEEVCEVPVTALGSSEVNQLLSTPGEIKEATVVHPLFIGDSYGICAGAETMLKYFTREYRGRINKATTSKGETYYGNNGIILDNNFNPLMLINAKIRQNGTIYYDILEYVVHLHPNVFLDDTKTLNKSLAKKGIAYYLSSSRYNWRTRSYIRYRVEIDDCSKFIVKTHKPDLQHCDNQTFNQVLKQNIDEVLSQVKDDFSIHL